MAEGDKAVVRRLLEEVWGAGSLDAVEDLIAPTEYRSHVPEASLPRMSRWTGPGIVRVEVAAYRSGFPDLAVEVHDILAEGETVVAVWGVGGTNTGTMRIEPLDGAVDEEVDPTGRELSTVGTTVFRISEGKIAEAAFRWDPLGLLEQLRLFAHGVRVLDLGAHKVSLVAPPGD